MVADIFDSLPNLPNAPRTSLLGSRCRRDRPSFLGTFRPRLSLSPYPQFSQAFSRCLGIQSQDPNIVVANKSPVEKLSQAEVEMIPLVHYIPAPEDQESTPIPKPSLEHAYPPSPSKPKPKKRPLFFWKKKKHQESSSPKKGTEPSGSGSADSWEGNWEKGEYPFVRLEGNRATCGICLMDFNAPRRVGENSVISQTQRHEGTEENGEGPTPLRLMACGHVYHVSEHPTVSDHR